MHPALMVMCSLVTLSALGQENLIPNPSFETAVDFEKIRDDEDWNKGMKDDTPDYFSFQTNSDGQPVHDNFAGRPVPRDGASYVGIFCYRVHPLRGVSDVREVVQVQLIRPLEKDSTYQFQVAVALDPESTHAINNLNVMFKNELSVYRNENKLFSEYAQIRFRGSFLEDTAWTVLQAEYKARGFEKYLLLGNLVSDRATGKKKVNFEPDRNKEKKWNLYPSEEAAYYYIDQLSLQLKKDDPGNEMVKETVPAPEVHPGEAPSDSITLDVVKQGTVFVLKKIYFEFDKAALLPESTAELSRLLRFLNRHPDISILIEGHTDNVGSHAYNMQLSEERASAVVQYLVEHGIAEDRLQFRGYGFTRPVRENSTDKNRSLNRRVAFRIIEP